jgi:hypothetical protein
MEGSTKDLYVSMEEIAYHIETFDRPAGNRGPRLTPSGVSSGSLFGNVGVPEYLEPTRSYSYMIQ